MATLEEYLDQIPEGEQERERFQVDTAEKADWALRKLAKIRRQRQENRRLAGAEIDKVKAWLAAEEERLERDEDYFLGLLADYHRRVLAEDPKAKTVRLPHGRLLMRAQPPEFERDEERLLEWLDARGMAEFVRTKREPDWQRLKPLVAATPGGAVVVADTGEVVEGVRATIRPPKFAAETE